MHELGAAQFSEELGQGATVWVPQRPKCREAAVPSARATMTGPSDQTIAVEQPNGEVVYRHSDGDPPRCPDGNVEDDDH